MELKIQGSSSFNLSGKIKDYIEGKVEKLNYFKSHIDRLAFHLDSEKLSYKVDATLSIKKFGVHKFEAVADEIYTAIDKIMHKIDTKILREKTRIQDHSNANHEEVGILLTKEKEESADNKIKFEELMKKPTALTDAYLQLDVEKGNILGFNLIDDENIISPAFLRKVEEDTVYLLKQESVDKYSEYLVTNKNGKVLPSKKVRDFNILKMSVKDAQESVLNHDYHYNVFINGETNRLSFIYKEENDKWLFIS